MPKAQGVLGSGSIKERKPRQEERSYWEKRISFSTGNPDLGTLIKLRRSRGVENFLSRLKKKKKQNRKRGKRESLGDRDQT